VDDIWSTLTTLARHLPFQRRTDGRTDVGGGGGGGGVSWRSFNGHILAVGLYMRRLQRLDDSDKSDGPSERLRRNPAAASS